MNADEQLAAAPQRTLQRDQEDELRRLRGDICRSVERHARLPQGA